MLEVQRALLPKAQRLLQHFPVLVILGARQVGKSTFSQQLGADWLYLDMENPLDRARVLNDPELFFADHPERLILDEAQAAPELFNILRGVIDRQRQQKGRFILTGSASFDLISQVSQSLAGRVAILEMHPLSQVEYARSSGVSFFDIISQPLDRSSMQALLKLAPAGEPGSEHTRKSLYYGGYPEPLLAQDPDFLQDWYENYFTTYIQRDILALFPQLDLLKYRRVILMLSHISHTIINRSEIARSIETSEKAVRDYLEIIEGTYFWRSLPAHQTPKIKTTTKLPKGHFRDSGLCCHLQGITSPSHLETYPRLGNLFEGYVIEEVIRGLEATSARQLHYEHFRTKSGGEIDLIITGSIGTLPIEVKYGTHTNKRDVRALQQFIDLHDLPLGIVINHAPRPLRISDTIIQVPVHCLNGTPP